jgi:SWI/SNF-related matrix-associated actin-dependent regulator 1 of chromatin subfamily A
VGVHHWQEVHKLMPLDLMPYQEEGATWLTQHTRAGLFDEMGIGKTAQAIRALDMSGLRRIMVVCPAMLRENWRAEFLKFAHMDRRIVKGQSLSDYVAWSRNRFDVLITSYEQATRWKPEFIKEGQALEALVIDESHYAKNPRAQRTKALFGQHMDGKHGLAGRSARTWLLTGTPMANDPTDIYPHLRLCKAWTGTESEFCSRYFYKREGTYSNRYTPKQEMVPELQQMIRATCLRRTKDDVGLELPPIFLTTLFVDGDGDEIASLLSQHPNLEDSILLALQSGGLSKLTDWIEWISTLRRLLGQSKAMAYAPQLVDEMRTYGGKRVVFGIHKEALRYVHAACLHNGVQAVLVTGDTPERERIAAVQAFQSDPRCQVFIGNIRAAGTGLTLVSSFEIDMLESDWSPAGNAQAIKRVHRYGQTQAVRGRFITLSNTFDVRVTEIVAGKTASIAMIDEAQMDAAPDVPNDVFTNALQSA